MGSNSKPTKKDQKVVPESQVFKRINTHRIIYLLISQAYTFSL